MTTESTKTNQAPNSGRAYFTLDDTVKWRQDAEDFIDDVRRDPEDPDRLVKLFATLDQMPDIHLIKDALYYLIEACFNDSNAHDDAVNAYIEERLGKTKETQRRLAFNLITPQARAVLAYVPLLGSEAEAMRQTQAIIAEMGRLSRSDDYAGDAWTVECEMETDGEAVEISSHTFNEDSFTAVLNVLRLYTNEQKTDERAFDLRDHYKLALDFTDREGKTRFSFLSERQADGTLRAGFFMPSAVDRQSGVTVVTSKAHYNADSTAHREEIKLEREGKYSFTGNEDEKLFSLEWDICPERATDPDLGPEVLKGDFYDYTKGEDLRSFHFEE